MIIKQSNKRTLDLSQISFRQIPFSLNARAIRLGPSLMTLMVLLAAMIIQKPDFALAAATAASPSAVSTAAVPAATPESADASALPSGVDQITKDFLIACEMSKLSVNLAKTNSFKADPADLAYRVAELMSGAFKTAEVKDTYKAILVASADSRVALWHSAAKQLGVKNFKCKTIGFK